MGKEELNDEKRHIDGVILVSNSVQGDSIDPGDVGAEQLFGGVPYQKTFTSHRISLNFGRVRPKDRVGEVKDGQVQPDKDDRADGGVIVGFARFGIYTTASSALTQKIVMNH